MARLACAAAVALALFANSSASRIQQGLREDSAPPPPSNAAKALARWTTQYLKPTRPWAFKNAAPSAFKNAGRRSPFVAMRFQPRAATLGRYRYSTRVGSRTPFAKARVRSVNLPTWTWSRMFMSTERALYFGRALNEHLARQEIQAARVLSQNSGHRQCSPEQLQEFQSRFGYDGGQTELSYKHPTSEMTAVYIITSQAGDHNGAFKGLDGGTPSKGFWNMCYRLLQMSAHYNVVYRRVNSVSEATEFVESVKGHETFGKALKHVTISGHGNPSVLVLGDERLRSGEVGKGNTETHKFLQALKPALIHTGDARSTVFLDSCSTGKVEGTSSAPLAQCVAEALPGVEIHAFDDLMYPATVKLQGDFLWNAQFESESKSKSGGTFKPTTFMAKEKASSATVLLQRGNSSEETAEPDFEFFDGISLLANVEMCAEWCAVIEECQSFEFSELEELSIAEHLSPFGRCVLHAAADVTAGDEPPFGYVGQELGR